MLILLLTPNWLLDDLNILPWLLSTLILAATFLTMMDRLFSRKPASPSSASQQYSSSSSVATAVSFGLPQQLASNPLYSEAATHLSKALHAGDSGHLTLAMDEYDKGLSLLMALLKSLPKDAEHEKSRETLRTIIGNQLAKAEEVKARKAMLGGSASSSSSASPAASSNLSSTHMLRSTSSPDQQKKQQQQNGGPFISPSLMKASSTSSSVSSSSSSSQLARQQQPASPPKQQFNIPSDLRQMIEREIVDPANTKTRFSDIVGLEQAKEALQELVILPALRPDLFSGIRAPPKGLLLYGPPGNGKSFIARAMAAEANATFFSISAATLVSKNMGEGERLVKALFQIATERAPSIVFIDEIDSILTRRSSEEHEASRRLKTECLVQIDALNSDPSQGRVVLIAATNIPEELDDAIVRRLARRIYMPPPAKPARLALLKSLLNQPSLKHSLTASQLDELAVATEGYSNSDLSNLVSDAAMGPLRGFSSQQLLNLSSSKLPPLTKAHFEQSLQKIRPSVSPERLLAYEAWAKKQEQR